MADASTLENSQDKSVHINYVDRPESEDPEVHINYVDRHESEDPEVHKSVHIVYVDRPESEDPEAFHVRTLASVLGSEEAAKDAIIYHYTHAASGFSAKLTAEQVEQLEKKEEVLQVMQDKILHVHSGQNPVGGMRTMHM